MASLSLGGYSVSWGYEGISEKQLRTVDEEKNLSGNKRFTNLTGVTSEALLSEAFKNIDIQYFVTSTGAKENIILKSADVQNEFTITYQVVGLTAKQTDDTAISFVNQDGEEIYRVLAPYMTDVKGVSSNQIELKLVSQEKDTVKVKLSVDKDFISDPTRAFPVTVDPEITKNFLRLFSIDECTNYRRVYNASIYIQGNFSKSVDYFSNMMDKLSGKHYSLRFNPFISSTDYIYSYYHYQKVEPNKLHYIWNGQIRPKSKVVVFSKSNPKYNLLRYNCLHMSLLLLSKGIFSKDDYYYQRTINVLKKEFIPNRAYSYFSFFHDFSQKNLAWLGYALVYT